MLEYAAMIGAPMRPEEIQELMRQTNQPVATTTSDTNHEPQTRMSHAQIDGRRFWNVDVADNKRLVLAIEQDAKVDILHACGGNARCTTCRVEFIEGEPSAMTAAEKERLSSAG